MCWVKVRVPEAPEAEFSAYQIHPASLDACLQVAGAAVATEAKENDKQDIYMPTHIDEIRIHARPGRHLWSYAHLQERETDAVKGDVRLLDEAGHAVVEILGLRFESLGGDAHRAVEENPG